MFFRYFYFLFFLRSTLSYERHTYSSISLVQCKIRKAFGSARKSG